MSGRTRTTRVGPKKAAPPSDGIDPRGDALVLTFVGPRTLRHVPARDLTGSDLARIAYQRRFQAALDADQPKPGARDGDPDVGALAAELIATGYWTDEAAPPPVDVPRETPTEDTTTTTEPDPPAETPEA